MKIKILFVALVLVIGLQGVGNAASLYYSDNPGSGVISQNVVVANDYWGPILFEGKFYLDGDGVEYINLTVIQYVSYTEHWVNHIWYSRPDITYTAYNTLRPAPWIAAYYKTGDSITLSYRAKSSYFDYKYLTGANDRHYVTLTYIYSNQSMDTYTVSGITDCVDDTSLYIKTSDLTYAKINGTNETTYNFPVIDGLDYKLVFDTHNYTFTVTGSNVVYNYDVCSHTTYRLEELCGNLIPDSEGTYTEYDGFWATLWDFYEPTGILDIINSSATKIAIHSHTFVGDTGWIIDPVTPDMEYTLTNPNIYWGLKVIVQNESDGTLIDGAMVQVNQDCYCTSGTSTRQKMTVSGMAGFIDMSLQDASLLVMKTGYKPINENSTGYSTFLSGRANFSSKTWICKLAPSWSDNVSSFYEVNNTVGIHFVDESWNRTSKIDDTDSEVYLYYENNNTEEEAMTLRFESSSTHTYFIPELQWTIAYDDIGHKTIANSYFTPWDYSYRAVIYNSSIYGWNLTIPLTVRNATKEEEAHYENLSTSIFFMYELNGKVDYRDPMKIGIHACSNNTTLMTTDIELWEDGIYLCHKNLTASDYTGSSFPYYYIWSPVYDYVSDSNYSVRMYGYDRTLLETDYVECVTDSTTRKNKLTIGVKDRSGANLNNCYIYLENWGSLSTGSTYYNAYEGIDNGNYRYKASKSGYTSSGWIDVNISDEDKIVWYTLTDDTASGAPVATKMTNNDIKGFFFPIMFLLFICILLGGLKYVS